jgi:hypothetical protein
MKNKSALVIIAVIFGFTQVSYAQCQGSCDSNQNTALGTGALLNNTTGTSNTATGFQALTNNISGSFNIGSCDEGTSGADRKGEFTAGRGAAKNASRG